MPARPFLGADRLDGQRPLRGRGRFSGRLERVLVEFVCVIGYVGFVGFATRAGRGQGTGATSRESETLARAHGAGADDAR